MASRPVDVGRGGCESTWKVGRSIDRYPCSAPGGVVAGGGRLGDGWPFCCGRPRHLITRRRNGWPIDRIENETVGAGRRQLVHPSIESDDHGRVAKPWIDQRGVVCGRRLESGVGASDCRSGVVERGARRGGRNGRNEIQDFKKTHCQSVCRSRRSRNKPTSRLQHFDPSGVNEKARTHAHTPSVRHIHHHIDF